MDIFLQNDKKRRKQRKNEINDEVHYEKVFNETAKVDKEDIRT